MPELRESAQWVVLATVVVLTPALLVVAGPVPTSSADVVVEARPSAPTKPGVAPIPPAPVAPRTGASAVWTGAELVVWGGSYGEHARPADPAEPTIAWQNAGDGAAYNPGRGTWRLLASSPLAGRSAHVAVWTGEEMIVWGGWSFDGDGQPTVREDGAAYNPLTDRWRPIAPAPIPGRGSAAAVWTGRCSWSAVRATTPGSGRTPPRTTRRPTAGARSQCRRSATPGFTTRRCTA